MMLTPTCTEAPIYSFLEPQLDMSIGSPGVRGISNGVVKPDTDVDDGTEISTVSLEALAAPCVTFLRKSSLLRWTSRCEEVQTRVCH